MKEVKDKMPVDFHKTEFVHWCSMRNVALGTINSENPRRNPGGAERGQSTGQFEHGQLSCFQ